MQIFVMNTDGKTVIVDVEPWDTIRNVKERMQVKIGIPIHRQRLIFNSRPLEEEKSLLHYNIQKESNLRLIIQTWNHSAYPEILPGPSVDWSEVADNAKDKVDKEIDEKKRKYESLLKEKSANVAKSIEIQAEIKHSLAENQEASRLVLVKEKEIKLSEKKIEKLNDDINKENETILNNKRAKRDISTQIEKETLKRMRKSEELGSLRNKISKLEEQMEETFVVASDRLEKENENLVKATTEKDQAIREFLNATILEKESLLECPVCFLTASPPIYKCTKEHLICCQCFPRMNNKCPTCRTGFSRNRSDNVFRFAEENWKELQKMKDKVEEI